MNVIITGGPCTGKSSLINALEAKGHHVHQEFARLVIKEQLTLGTNKVPWDDNHGFSSIVLDKMQHLNASIPTNEVHFLDRGIPDLAAYLALSNDPLPHMFKEHLIAANYHKTVFILPPWEDIYMNDTERREDFGKAIAIYESLKTTYTKYGFQLIELPRESVDSRANIVLEHLDRYKRNS